MATFGKTTKGNLSDDIDGSKLACQFTAPEDGILTAISVYLRNYDLGTQVSCVYSDNNDMPDALLASVTRTDIPATEGWYEFVGFNLQITGGIKYWLALCAGTYTRTWCDSVVCRARGQPRASDYPPPSNPFGSGTDYTDRQYSIYATYTPAFPPVKRLLSLRTTPITGVSFSLNGVTKTTPYSEELPEGSYTVTMPSTVTVGTDTYLFVRWNDGDINLTRTVLLAIDISLVAEYELYVAPPPPPTFQLTVDSTPIQGIPFTIEKVT